MYCNGIQNYSQLSISIQCKALAEFLNRIDEVLIFNRLGPEELSKIVEIQLDLVCDRVASQGFLLEWTTEVREFLAESGYDPAYGARPLKRAIQGELENPLAIETLQGRFVPGDSIRVSIEDADGQGKVLVFRKF